MTPCTEGCDQELHVTYTLYTFLVLGYGVSTTYGGTTGPGALLYPGDTFESVGVREIIHDSNEQIRQGKATPPLKFNRKNRGKTTQTTKYHGVPYA